MHKDPISRIALQKLYTSFNLEETGGLCVRTVENWILAIYPLAQMIKADNLCIWQGIMRQKTTEMTKTIEKEGECTNLRTILFVSMDLYGY